MKKTLKDYAIVLFGTGFSRGVAFLNSVIIARILGPEDFGKFSLFFITMILTWLFPQSFDSVYVRYAKTSNSHSEKDEFLKVSVFLKLVYAGTVLILSYPAAHILAVFCFHKPEIKLILIWAMISGVFQAFLMTIASIFQEKEKFTMFSFLYSFYTVSIFLMLMAIKWLRLNFSLENVIMVHVLVSIIIGCISLYLLFKKKIKNLFPLHPESLKTSLSLGKWMLGIAVLSYLFQRMDFLFLARHTVFESLGVYGAAQQIVLMISVMTGSVAGVFLPKACKALESKESFKAFKKESFLISVLINIMVIILIATAPFIIKLLYGNTYAQAGDVARILLIGWIAAIFYSPFGGLFYALDDSKTRFWLEVSRFFIAAAFLGYLIPHYGIIGAAWAISITLILSSIISIKILKKRIACKFMVS